MSWAVFFKYFDIFFVLFFGISSQTWETGCAWSVDTRVSAHFNFDLFTYVSSFNIFHYYLFFICLYLRAVSMIIILYLSSRSNILNEKVEVTKIGQSPPFMWLFTCRAIYQKNLLKKTVQKMVLIYLFYK